MADTIKLLAAIVNFSHDFILKITRFLGLPLSDKDLHFWIFGLFGFITFVVVDWLFKWISKWGISFISFIYTFTIMAVLALSLEIMQKVTKRGNMEFFDFIYGLWGFLVFWFVFSILRWGWRWIMKRLSTK